MLAVRSVIMSIGLSVRRLYTDVTRKIVGSQDLDLEIS